MPARVMFRPEKLATPVTALRVAVPLTVAPDVPVPGLTATVTALVKLVSSVPKLSTAWRTGCDEKAAPRRSCEE